MARNILQVSQLHRFLEQYKIVVPFELAAK